MDISQKIEAIEKKLMMLQNSVNLHIGSYGEDVHALADDNNAGFLAPDLAKLLRQRKRSRSWVNDSDIMTLEPGYYTGVGFINAPMTNITWQCDVDIYWGYDGRKNIFFYENVSNRIYHTTVTSDNLGNIFSWQVINTSKVLYNGSPTIKTDEGFVITLSEKLADYTYIEVWVHNTLNNLPFVFKMNRTYGSGSQVHFYNSEPNKGDMSELSITIGDTNKARITNNIFNKTVDGAITETIKNALVVTKIIGIRGV